MKERNQANENNPDVVNLSDLSENQYIKRLLSNKIVRYFCDDPSSKIALVTAIITLGSFSIKMLDYLWWKGYLSVFSINIESVNYSGNYGFSEFLLQAIIFAGLIVAISLSYLAVESLWMSHSLRKAAYSITKTKLYAKFVRFIKETISKIPMLAIVVLLKAFINALLWIFTASPKILTNSSIGEWVATIFTFSLIELITACCILIGHNRKIKAEIKAQEKEKQKTHVEKKREAVLKSIRIRRPILIDLSLNSVVLLMFLMSTVAYFAGMRDANSTTSFPFVEENYAVIFQNDENYWTVAATADGEVLKLDTTHQRIVPISGSEIIHKGYSDVKIEYGSN